MKNLYSALAALALLCSPVQAQWQTPNHSVPVGVGGGAMGFNSVGPCTAGIPLVGQGPTADPSCGPLNLGATGAVIGNLPVANLNNGAAASGTTFWAGDGTWKTPSGSGSVAGPVGATGGHIATFNGITGSLIQDQTSIDTAQNVYFGSGRPWFDVLSATHGCAAADPTGAADSTTAIQCHINYMNATFGGGFVFFPSGTYLVSAGGVVVTAGVWLEGSGPANTLIQVATDSTAVSFAISGGACPSGGHLGGLEKMSVFGYQVNTSTQAAAKIGSNCSVTIRDAKIWFGAQALFNAGVDSYVEGSYICGWQQCVYSTGANWYIRNKFDSIGVTMVGSTQAAFLQGPYSGPGGATAIAENHFTQSDFSGPYTWSLYVDDGNNLSSILHVDGGVFSAGVFLNHHRFTMITATEIGSSTFINNAGSLLMSSSPAFVSTTVTGAGGKACAGNANFTNC